MSFWNTASLSRRISSSVLLLRALCKILPTAQAVPRAWCVMGEGSAEWEQMWPEPRHLLGTLSHPQSTFISNHLWHIWLCEGLIWWYPLQLHHIVFALCPGAKTSKDSKPALPGRARGWPPRGQPLASGGQELVGAVSRLFGKPFLFNLSLQPSSSTFASGGGPQLVRAVTKFPSFLLPFLVSFPQVNYLHTGSCLRFCFLGKPSLP